MRDPVEALVDLVWRVPVHAIDAPAAQRAGDTAALRYAAAMAAWRDEASQLVAAALSSSPARTSDAPPDAYARTATVSALTRLPTP